MVGQGGRLKSEIDVGPLENRKKMYKYNLEAEVAFVE